MSTTRKIKSPTRFVRDAEIAVDKGVLTHAGMGFLIAQHLGISVKAGEQTWRRARTKPEMMKFTTALAIARAINLSIYYTEEK